MVFMSTRYSSFSDCYRSLIYIYYYSLFITVVDLFNSLLFHLFGSVVSVGFFDDILIPSHRLMEPSEL